MTKTKPKDVIELIEEGVFIIEHGDYQRIASLTKNDRGVPFTADYVRKVLKGMRNNKAIKRKARFYLKRKKKLHDSLRDEGLAHA